MMSVLHHEKNQRNHFNSFIDIAAALRNQKKDSQNFREVIKRHNEESIVQKISSNQNVRREIVLLKNKRQKKHAKQKRTFNI